MRTSTLFTALWLILAAAGCTRPEFRPGAVWTDTGGAVINAHGGGILYDEGRYYWFGEHKTAGEAGNLAQVGIHCYSSENLYDWRDEGIALSVAPEGSGSPIEKGCILERPKVIRNARTGKYVMWFHLEPKGAGYTGALSGVAVSDRATAPTPSCGPNAPTPGFIRSTPCRSISARAAPRGCASMAAACPNTPIR